MVKRAAPAIVAIASGIAWNESRISQTIGRLTAT
jgi:hypothetical protein